MDLFNWSLLGFGIVALLGLIAWKPRAQALAVIRISLLVFQLLLLSSGVCFRVFEHLKSDFWWIVIGVLPPALIWFFLIFLIKKENKSLPFPTERIILAVNLGVILAFTLNWVFVYVLTTTFLLIFPLAWVVLLFSIAFLWALSYGFRRGMKERTHSLKPFLFCAATALTVILIPLNNIGNWTNCWIFLLPRESVIHQIQSGSLKVEGRTIQLSGWKRFLSLDGKVEVQGSGNGMKVMFIDAEGFLSDFSGLIYCCDGSAPQEGDFTMVNSEFKKLKDHWYYGISRN